MFLEVVRVNRGKIVEVLDRLAVGTAYGQSEVVHGGTSFGKLRCPSFNRGISGVIKVRKDADALAGE